MLNINSTNLIEWLTIILFSTTIIGVFMWIIIPQIFKWLILNNDFYCQRQIEDKLKCTKQCEHCKEYYKPLEKMSSGMIGDA